MRKKVQNGVNIINFFRVLVMGDGIKLFVYGVRPSCPRELLEREFSKSGQVSDIFNTGKGYAFVTMADEDGAQAAIKQINGQMIKGQKIKVNIAHGQYCEFLNRRESPENYVINKMASFFDR